jgi:hypothetical protein
MRDDVLQRQVALVSYGTTYPRGEQPLEAFYGQRLLFRAHDDNGLLAADFTLSLAGLHAQGARRRTPAERRWRQPSVTTCS